MPHLQYSAVIFVLVGGQWSAMLVSCGAVGHSRVLTITWDREKCSGVAWCQETLGMSMEAFSKLDCVTSSS